MLIYLQGYNQPEIYMTVHQCAIFCNNPRLVHKRAVKRIEKYLVSKSTYTNWPVGNSRLSACGVVYSPDKEKTH